MQADTKQRRLKYQVASMSPAARRFSEMFFSLLVLATLPLHHQGKQKLGAARKNLRRILKTQVTDHDCPNAERSQRRSSGTPLSAKFFTLHIFSLSSLQDRRIVSSLFVENRVNAPIFLNTQALVEHLIKDFREHAHTQNVGCHGPHQLSPLPVELPSQKPFTAVHFSVMPRLSTIMFL